MIKIKVKKSGKMKPLALLLAAAAVAVSFYSQQHQQTKADPNLYTVARVVDGDTLALSNGEKVRLIGVDTPESSSNPKLYRDSNRTGQDTKTILALGARAKAFTKTLCEGKSVRLVTDVQPRDKYGRLLAYVYLDDKTFVNAELIKSGYARVYTIPPNVKYKDLFLDLQREARAKQRGLWG